jgi:hypothetical protein
MAYGRWTVASIDSSTRLLITYRPSKDQTPNSAASGSGLVSRAARYLFRAQVESDRAKRIRWWTESAIGPRIAGDADAQQPDERAGRHARRSRSVRGPTSCTSTSCRRTAFADVRAACRQVIPAFVPAAAEYHATLCRGRPRQRPRLRTGAALAAVLLFSQEKTARGEADMARMTHALIDRVLDIGGPTTCRIVRTRRSISWSAAIARRRVRREKREPIVTCCSATAVGRLLRPFEPERIVMGKLRVTALVYMLVLLAAASLNYIPGLTDAQGARSACSRWISMTTPARGIGGVGRLRRIHVERCGADLPPYFGSLYLLDGCSAWRPAPGFSISASLTTASSTCRCRSRFLRICRNVAGGGFAVIASFVFKE